MITPVVLDGRTLTIEQVADVARGFAPVVLGHGAAARVERSRLALHGLIDRGATIYGVTTGLADHKGTPVSRDEIEGFQRRIVLSHVVGVGAPLPADVVRAMMLARASMLGAGGSGAGRGIIDLLIALLNHRIHPLVPEKGSLGVTDLAHLAHIAQVLLGEGAAEMGDRVMPAREALETASLQPVRLGPKEGLALISSNAGSVGRGALVLHDIERLVRTLDVAAALSLEAFRGNVGAFDPEIEQAHPDPGQAATAARLRALMAGSDLHDPGTARSVQDPYSFRCAPQCHGALRNSVEAARGVVELELTCAADTPLISASSGTVRSNGNFLALNVALAFEQLAVALAHTTAFSVARTRALMAGRLTGLPGTLVASPQPQTGFSILQETATSLQTGIRLRANPSSLDFQPIADGIEDHATNAMDAVAKVEAGIRDAALIASVEFLVAAQAVDLRMTLGQRLRLGHGTRLAYETVRGAVPFLTEDEPLAPLVDRVAAVVRASRLGGSAESA